ncbi:MAG TPA: ABC transporter ATP-binding protein [bacterium]|nr:ABC transporter ATP-binding protein [bacterium]
MPLLATEGLWKSFGDMHAVHDVGFSVDEKQLVALVGSNGAGKTTLVNLITGLLRPDRGSIHFQGQDVTALPVYDRIKAGITRSFQIVNLFDALTTLDNVRLAIFSREGKVGKAASLAERDRDAREQALGVIDEFGLTPKWDVPAGQLAQGERKLLDVAVAYALGPRLILLDEPTSGVGTREKGQIMDRIEAVVRSRGLSAVIVEHDMDVVFKYSDRMVVMHEGQVLAEGVPDQIVRDERIADMLGRR